MTNEEPAEPAKGFAEAEVELALAVFSMARASRVPGWEVLADQAIYVAHNLGATRNRIAIEAGLTSHHLDATVDSIVRAYAPADRPTLASICQQIGRFGTEGRLKAAFEAKWDAQQRRDRLTRPSITDVYVLVVAASLREALRRVSYSPIRLESRVAAILEARAQAPDLRRRCDKGACTDRHEIYVIKMTVSELPGSMEIVLCPLSLSEAEGEAVSDES